MFINRIFSILLIALVTLGLTGGVFAPATGTGQHPATNVASLNTTSGSPSSLALGECSTALATPATSSITPNDGILNFGCGFSINEPANYQGYSFTPTFTLPQYYARLGVRTDGTCMVPGPYDPFWIPGYGTPTIWTNLTSSQSVMLGATSTYNYCAAYANVPSSGGVLPSFTITWSNGTYTFPTQTFPSVTIPQRTGTFTGCTTTAVDPSESTAPATSGSGSLLIGCADPLPICGDPCATIPAAFDVSQTAYYTPTFSLPNNYYTSIALMGSIGCSPGHSQAPIPITSRTEIRIVDGVEYYYCLSYMNGSNGLPSFTISWASGSTVFTQTIPNVPASFPARPLTINFAFSPTGPFVGQGISFTAREVGGTPGYTLNWSFGDGSSIGGPGGTPGQVVHSYSAAGIYSVSLTVTDSATPTHNTATVTQAVVVSASSSDPSFPVTGSVTFQGVKVSLSGNLSVNTNIISGSLTVTATNSSTGATLFSKTYTITNLQVSNNQAKFLLNIPVSTYSLSSDIIATFNGNLWTSSFAVTRQLDVMGNGTVNIQDLATIAVHFDSAINTPGYSPTADIDANGSINIVDLATVAIYYGAPDYS